MENEEHEKLQSIFETGFIQFYGVILESIGLLTEEERVEILNKQRRVAEHDTLPIYLRETPETHLSWFLVNSFKYGADEATRTETIGFVAQTLRNIQGMWEAGFQNPSRAAVGKRLRKILGLPATASIADFSKRRTVRRFIQTDRLVVLVDVAVIDWSDI